MLAPFHVLEASCKDAFREKRKIMFRKAALFLALALVTPSMAFAAIDTGDSAWITTSTALVLFMTLPGLALFYAGLVQPKNIVSVLMHHFAIACLCSLLWVIAGYSIAFSGDGAWFGNLDNLFMSQIGFDSLSGTIPESLFATFQMTFAVITPALVIGAYVERIKFSTVLIFSGAWMSASGWMHNSRAAVAMRSQGKNSSMSKLKA